MEGFCLAGDRRSPRGWHAQRRVVWSAIPINGHDYNSHVVGRVAGAKQCRYVCDPEHVKVTGRRKNSGTQGQRHEVLYDRSEIADHRSKMCELARKDSNLQPLEPESSVLPVELRAKANESDQDPAFVIAFRRLASRLLRRAAAFLWIVPLAATLSRVRAAFL